MNYHWGIIRSPGHVKSTFEGSKEDVGQYLANENNADNTGSSEVITVGMTEDEANEWISE
jgi:hypothetical protein